MKHYSVPEVAKVCGVSSKTVRSWIENGHLKAGQLPLAKSDRYRTFRVEAEQLLRFLRANDIARECGLYATLSPATCPVLRVLKLFVDIDHFEVHIEDETKYLGVLGKGGTAYDAEAADPVVEAALLYRAIT